MSSLLLWIALISLMYTHHIVTGQAATDDQKVYIVYMGDRPKDGFSVESHHTSMLQEVVGSRASESLLHSYKRSFSGFVAKLTEEEKNKLAAMEGVVSVFPNSIKERHTTRSWDFMGFPQQVQRIPLESDIIVAVLDSGIWPESASFSDDGLGPPPSKWKGTCQSSANFTCNNKIIGAKSYNIASGNEDSPRDTEGHGTHTSSTAAGSVVRNANVLGLANGTARGGVPSARIAAYKVCGTCSDADILAGFDDAIADGVDVISVSLGGPPLDYFKDSLAIGAFHSMKNGILTSISAGNDGPRPGTVLNNSPWSLSVAASTIDRKFVATVQLGSGQSLEGLSINTFDLKKASYPLVYGGDVPDTKAGYTGAISRYCRNGSLDKTLVNGTIVLCDEWNFEEAAFHAGAVGTIIQDDVYHDVAMTWASPASYLTPKDGGEVLLDINASSKPTATILRSVVTEDILAPHVATFSSRGPNRITTDILKPDLTAPGVDILAAWSEATTMSEEDGDSRIVPYNIISGTSMSCPHATGAAAYVKSFHPDWSAAAIKSALMTTASVMSVTKNSDAEFAYGSGHIDPAKAANPGLVYDAGEADFVQFLCGQGYNPMTLKLVTGDNSSCSTSGNGTVWDLNYPSFALSTTPLSNVTRVFQRTVTNVGSPVSIYKAMVAAPPGLEIQVEPSVLSFKALGQKQSFSVTVGAMVGNASLSGTLVWDDGMYQVRSPIIAFPYGRSS